MVCLCSTGSFAAPAERLDISLRGQRLSLSVYYPNRPPSQVKGTILMGSGDVGWVGLAVSMAELLSDQGYVVVGINIREYLAAYTSKKRHLETSEVPGDYAEIAAFLRGRGLLREPVMVSGVSEGAGLAILAASDPANHAWITGVITMGLPGTVDLAWRWTDFTSWITKKESGEPSFASRDYVAKVSPLPLYMIQSIRDEYVTEREYRDIEAAARPPRTLVLIAASNHRFTDKIAELHQAYLAGLEGILNARKSAEPR
jgi:fermentation-respiration switch protein FrsA (DUF1100 family)